MDKQQVIDYAETIALAADEKKAKDIVILDLRGISIITDHFIICHANSTVQTRAIAENIIEQLGKRGVKPLRREGMNDGHWILLDYGHCVAHIFTEEERNFYGLERLWGDAKSVGYQGVYQS